MNVNAVLVMTSAVCLLTLFLNFGPTLGVREESALKWLSALGPIIAIGLFVVAFLQFDLTRQSAERQQRAYLGVSNHQISNTGLNQSPLFHVVIKNFGLTPAFKVRYWVTGVLKPYPPSSLDDVEFRPAKLPLFPTDTIDLIFSSDPLTPQQFAAVQDGASRIYVYGRVQYFDAFNVERNTRFRLQFGGKALIDIGRMAWTDSGNEAD